MAKVHSRANILVRTPNGKYGIKDDTVRADAPHEAAWWAPFAQFTSCAGWRPRTRMERSWCSRCTWTNLGYMIIRRF
jgi:hypothetical protein